MSSVYEINKGVNKPILFKGLMAQYIGYLAGSLLGLLVLYVVLYISGVNNYVCLVLTGSLGTAVLTVIFRMNHQYGQYGLLKKSAKRSIPVYLKFRTRRTFINLLKKK